MTDSACRRRVASDYSVTDAGDAHYRRTQYYAFLIMSQSITSIALMVQSRGCHDFFRDKTADRGRTGRTLE
jgi:hypothetical protein